MYRIAFDPALPVVAAHPFNAKDKRYATGEDVDWKALGVSERVALDWWLAGTISHPIKAKAPSAKVVPKTPPQKRAQRK